MFLERVLLLQIGLHVSLPSHYYSNLPNQEACFTDIIVQHSFLNKILKKVSLVLSHINFNTKLKLFPKNCLLDYQNSKYIIRY